MTKIDNFSWLQNDYEQIQNRLNTELTQLKTKLAQKEKEVDVILNSYIWKTGRVLLSPVRFLRQLKKGRKP